MLSLAIVKLQCLPVGTSLLMPADPVADREALSLFTTDLRVSVPSLVWKLELQGLDGILATKAIHLAEGKSRSLSRMSAVPLQVTESVLALGFQGSGKLKLHSGRSFRDWERKTMIEIQEAKRGSMKRSFERRAHEIMTSITSEVSSRVGLLQLTPRLASQPRSYSFGQPILSRGRSVP